MKKNVASQVMGAQLISKTDGSAVTTGTTTIYITGDAGTQAAGSVGAGACTHEGNGYWTYAPAQAETNYDQIAATFVNTAACNVTIQYYTTFPQTGDSFARLGAPAGASVSADIAAVKVDSAAIKTKTDYLPSATAGAAGGVFIAGSNAATSITTALTANITGNLSGSVGSVTGAVGSVTGAVGSVTAGVTVTTNNDKTGYALTQAFPTNFSSMAITVGGAVTAGTVSDKTGYALAQSFPTNFAAMAITAGGAVTAGTVSDKSDYVLSAGGVTAVQSGLATQASVNTIDDFLDTEVAAILAAVDTEVAAIKDKTDSLTFTVSGQVDANVQYINDIQLTGNGTTVPMDAA